MAAYHRIGWITNQETALAFNLRVRTPDPTDTSVTYTGAVYAADNGHANHHYIFVYSRNENRLPRPELSLESRRLSRRTTHTHYIPSQGTDPRPIAATAYYDVTYDNQYHHTTPPRPPWPVISPTGLAV